MSEQNLDARLVLLDEDHSGRDEMNLAGNPFALLRAASRTDQPFLHREYERTLANGKTVLATWEVNGHAELGLPGPNEEILYLILLQLTREQIEISGEWPQTVNFSRLDVIKRLRWSGNARDYSNLEQAFFRLQAVSIQTRYSFYDPKTGIPFPALGFNIIDSFAYMDEKKHRSQAELPLSWFKWSDVIYNSLRTGNVRSLALDFTLSLESSVSRRLFRLLELLRHAKKPALAEIRLEVLGLRDRLGMTKYAYTSKIKQVVEPAIKELVGRGYLESVQYEKTGKTETAVFKFARVNARPIPLKEPKPSVNAPQEIKTVSKTNSEPSDREIIVRGAEIWKNLSESDQKRLLDEAKKIVQPAFHDRLVNPKSPISIELFKRVVRDFS